MLAVVEFATGRGSRCYFIDLISILFFLRLKIARRAVAACWFLIQLLTMIEHFELAQESRSCLCDAELCQGRVIKLRNAPYECSVLCAAVDRSRYIRLSSELSPDLVVPQLETLSTLCLAARRSEEFFLSANATDQWLRTIIGHESLPPGAWTEAETWIDLIPSFIIHSNILPYDPYWSGATGDEARTRVHFPSYVLKEALEERKPLKRKLLEWRSTGKECEIAKHGTGRSEDESFEQPRTSKLFWEIQGVDVKLVREFAAGSDGTISLITWKGGRFVRKEFKPNETHDYGELEVVKKFSHPHIVYSFGVLCDGVQTSYFMEYMSNDLFSFIVDRVQRVVGDNEPPFSRRESVDVLSQVAKAMKHMHQENVNVVHCDLKSQNILISEIATSDNVKHFLVKVTDFGSARSGESSSSSGFIPGAASTNYAAPEVLNCRSDATVRIEFPHKIDVYSFGIVAFEVLTGKNNVKVYNRSPPKFKRGVIGGTLRPPLRAECKKQKLFTRDGDLISLIERCWHNDSSERPSFVEICEELNNISDRMLVSEQMLQSGHPPCEEKSFWSCLKLFPARGASVLKKQKVSTSMNPS